MRNLLRPAGPLPVSVYWVRRGIVVLVLVAVALLVRAVWPGGSASTSTSNVTTPSTKATSTAGTGGPAGSASPSASPPAPVVPACPDTSISVKVSPDATTYRAGVRPRFTLTVRNSGTVSCRRDVSAATLGLTVTSGGARVWSSDDCQRVGGAAVKILAPGATHSTTVIWSRQLSAKGCPSSRPEAGPGTYVVLGSAGAVNSARVVFSLG